ncbi:MAG: DoxX family protein [Bacteroidia bacterium]|nr:DoxX family protein [Bacteroidia bacterium]MBT8279795.1 DoxX family protein [Bacteroidia bacterium]NND25037.1 DoxX family protein [Flavobacteriaceae bacterium]NNK61371.1 DoxX family protein [Flavobacteriaceae bacterium]RZW44850.1 MAG: DoxX family protein [Flavobacteriaceae bacterium]
MDYIAVVFQIIVGLSILNVWLLQSKKPTAWRGGNAKTIIEEFKVYGLPVWMCYVIGTLKVLLAIGLILSIWYPQLKQVSAIGLAILLIGSIAMHVMIEDPFKKSLPASLFLLMCLYIAFSNQNIQTYLSSLRIW